MLIYILFGIVLAAFAIVTALVIQTKLDMNRFEEAIKDQKYYYIHCPFCGQKILLNNVVIMEDGNGSSN